MSRILAIFLVLLMLFSFSLAYKAPTFDPQDLVVESDSRFYGSADGNVYVDLNITNIALVDHDVYLNIKGLELYDVWLEEVYVKTEADSNFKEEKVKEKTKPLKMDKTIKFKTGESTLVRVHLSYDREQMGIGKEFIVEFLDDTNTIIGDLDPWLSGWSYSKDVSLDTNRYLVDTFEDGDLNTAPDWAATINGTGSVQSSVEFTKDGNYSLKMSGGSGYSVMYVDIREINTFDVGAWVYVTTLGNRIDFSINRSSDSEKVFQYSIEADGDLAYHNGSTFVDTGQDINTDTWFYLRVVWVNDDSNATYYLYDSDMTELYGESHTAKNPTYSPDRFGFDCPASTVIYLDDARYDKLITSDVDINHAVPIKVYRDQNFDGFEDGDYTNNFTWNTVDADNPAIEGTIVKNGSYSLEQVIDAGGGSFYADYNWGKPSRISIWSRTTAYTAGGYMALVAWMADPTQSVHKVRIRQETTTENESWYMRDAGNFTYTQTKAFTTDTWYRYELNFDWNTGRVIPLIYDSSDDLFATPQAFDFETTYDINRIEWRADKGAGQDAYADDLIVEYEDGVFWGSIDSKIEQGDYVDTNLYLEDFNDGDYTGSPVWTVHNGSWSIDTGAIKTTTHSGRISTPLSQTLEDGWWFSVDMKAEATSNNCINFLSSTNDYDNAGNDGYVLCIAPTNIRLLDRTNASNTQIADNNVSGYNDLGWHNYKIIYQDRYFFLYIDNEFFSYGKQVSDFNTGAFVSLNHTSSSDYGWWDNFYYGKMDIGEDIRFTIDGETEQDYYIELLRPHLHEFLGWTRYDQNFSSSVKSDLFINFDNVDATDDQNASGTFQIYEAVFLGDNQIDKVSGKYGIWGGTTSYKDGINGSAYKFNGSSYIDIDFIIDDTNFYNTDLSDKTVFSQAITSASGASIYPGGGYYCHSGHASCSVYGFFYSNKTAANVLGGRIGGPTDDLVGSTTINTGRWYDYMHTIDPNDTTGYIYLDEIQEDSQSAGTNINTTGGGKWGIGALWSTSAPSWGSYWTGEVDNLIFANHEFSQDERMLFNDLYNVGVISFESENATGASTMEITNVLPQTFSWVRGDYNIYFDMYDPDQEGPIDLNIYYSSTPGAFENLIVEDTNLGGAAVSSTPIQSVDGWEDNTVPSVYGWSPGGAVTVETTQPHSGTYSLLLNNGENATSSSIYVAGGYDVNYEMWIWSGNVGATPGGSRFYLYDDTNTAIASAWIQRSGFNQFYIGGVAQVSSPVSNTWYKYVHNYTNLDANVRTWIFDSDGVTQKAYYEYPAENGPANVDKIYILNSNASTNYYDDANIVYVNTSAVPGPIFCYTGYDENIDSWESATTSSIYDWNESGGTPAISSAVAKTGTYSVELATDDELTTGDFTSENDVNNQYYFWIYPTAASSSSAYMYLLDSGSSLTNGIGIASGTFRFGSNDTGVGYDINNWYKIMVYHENGSRLMNGYVYDSSNNLVTSLEWIASYSGGTVTNISIGQYSSNTVYIDDFSYSKEGAKDTNFTANRTCSYSVDTTGIPDGNWYFDVNGVGSPGDSNSSGLIGIDNNAPFGTVDNNGLPWHTSDFNVVFDMNFDPSGEGNSQVRIDGGAWQDFNEDHNVLIQTDGNHTVDYNFGDNAGNVLTGTVQALLDATAPVIGGVVNAVTWLVAPFYLVFTGISDATSGIASIFISVDGGAYTDTNIINAGTPMADTFTSDTSGDLDWNGWSGTWVGSPTHTNPGALRLTSGQYRYSQSDLGFFNGVDNNYGVWFRTSSVADNISVRLGTRYDSNVQTIANVEFTDGYFFIQDINTEVPAAPNVWYSVVWQYRNQDANVYTWVFDQDGITVLAEGDYASVVGPADANSYYLRANASGQSWFDDVNYFDVNIYADYNMATLINTDGNHTVDIWVQDVAGNDYNFQTFAYLDQNGPDVLSVDGNGLPWKAADFNVLFDVNFDPSGESNSQYRIDGGAWNNFGAYLTMSDGFEDGDYNVDPEWSEYLGFGGVTTDVNDIIYKNGSKSLKIDTNPFTSYYLYKQIDGDINSYTTWVYLEDFDNGFFWGVSTNSTPSFDKNEIFIYANPLLVSYWYVVAEGTVYYFDSNVDIDANTWYKLRLDIVSDSDILSAYVYDTNEDLVTSRTNINLGKTYGQEYIYARLTGDDIVYLDDITYGGQLDENYVVPINTDGNYTVDYNFTDNAGNSTTGVVQALFDATAPVYDTVINAATWIVAPFYIIVTGITDVTSGIFDVWVSENGGGYVDGNFIDGNLYIDVNQDGNHTYNVWIQDNAGNDTNIEFFGYLDQNVPEILSITNDGLPWKSADFNIIFDVNFDFAGDSNSVYRLDGGAWVTFTTDYNVPITSDGNITVDYNFRDAAGNYNSGIVYGLHDSGTSIIDEISGSNDWNNQDFNIQFNVTPGGSGIVIAKYSRNGGEFWDFNYVVSDTNYYIPITTIDGNHQIDYWFQTGSGVDTNGTVYGKLDTNAPLTSTNTTASLTSWNNTPPMITLDCNDDLWNLGAGQISGCDFTSFRFNDGTWFRYDGNQNISDDAEYNINGLLATYIPTYNQYGLDANRYVISAKIDMKEYGSGNYSVYLKYFYTDGTTSNSDTLHASGTAYVAKVFSTMSTVGKDVNQIELYAIETDFGGAVTNLDINMYDSTIDGNIYIVDDGNYKIDFNSVDVVDPEESPQTIYVAYDGTGPVRITDANFSVWKNTDFNARVDVNWDVSGKQWAKASVDGGAWIDFNSPNDINNYLWNTGDDANRTVVIWLKDNADNDTNLIGYTLLDKSAPDVQSVDNNGLPWHTTDFNVIFDVNFDVSGDGNSQVSIDGGAWQDLNVDYNVLINTDGNHTIDYNFTDNAGNSTTGIVQALFDATAPVIGAAINVTSWMMAPFYIILTGVTDATSGIFDVWVSEDGGGFVDANLIDTNVYVDVNVDGNHQYDFWIRDVAGNDYNVTYYGALSQYGPDVVPDGNGLPWKNADFNVTFDVNFEPSGELNSVYRYDGGAWQSFDNFYTLKDDNFEDGDLLNPTWSCTGAGSNGLDSNYVQAHDGNYSLRVNSEGGGTGWCYNTTIDTELTTLGAWMRVEHPDTAGNFELKYFNNAGFVVAGVRVDDGNFNYLHKSGVGGDTNVVVDGNAWYYVLFQLGGSTTYTWYIYDSSLSLLNSGSHDTDISTGDYKPHNIYFYSNSNVDNNAFIDQVIYDFDYNFLTIPITDDGNHTIDFNFTKNGGNWTYGTFQALLDENAPTYNSIENPGTSWQNTDFNVVVVDTNFLPSGVFHAQCQVSAGGFIDMNVVDNNYYCLIDADANNDVNIWLRDNAGNDTNINLYAAFDATAPSVGATTIIAGTGGTVYTTYFRGLVDIVGGVATDDTSGIDTSTCEVFDDSWFAGSWNTNHCESIDVNVGLTEGVYAFNTRVQDNAGNLGTGTQGNYTMDRTAPITTVTSYRINATDENVIFTCTDSSSGCADVYYMVDNNGDWQSVAAPTTWVTITSALGLHSIDYYSLDNVDNNEWAQAGDFNTYDFNTYGTMTIRVRDENSTIDLNDVTLTVGTNTYTIQQYRTFDLNTWTTGYKSFMFTKTDYGTRYYEVDFNNVRNYDINFLLLGNPKGSVQSFTMYDYNTYVVMPNSFVDFIRMDQNSRVYGWIAGRRKASAAGVLTNFVSTTDSNYDQNILKKNGDVNRYVPVKLHILKPKNEVTLALIDGNWRYDFKTILINYDRNVIADTNVFVLPNTTLTYQIDIVDEDDTYFTRTYNLDFPGNPMYYQLQPYLVSSTDGEVIKFLTRQPQGKEVPFVTIEVYKTTAGGRELFGSVITDSAGSAAMALVASETYEYDLYYNGNKISPDDFQLTTLYSTYYFTISSLEYVSDIYKDLAPTVIFTPGGLDRIEDTTTSVSQDVNARETADVNFIIYQYLFDNNNTGRIDRNWVHAVCNTTCDNTFLTTHADLNVLKPFYIDVNILTDANTSYQTFTKRYITESAIEVTGMDLVGLFISAKADFGCPATWESFCPLTMLLTIIIAIIATGGLMFKFGWSNPFGLSIFGGMIVAIGTAVGWFYLPALIIILVVGIIGQMSRGVDR